MRGTLVALAIVVIMILGSFGAVGTHLSVENEIIETTWNDVDFSEENDCGCDNVETVDEERTYLPGLSSEDIAALQEQGEAEGWTFTVGENDVTARSLDRLCGLIVPDDWWIGASFDPCLPTSFLPDTFDWRNKDGEDYTTPVKNQGSCGSCWAFSTVGPLECNIKYKDGDTVDLSEQWLVSCNSDGWDCDGGFFAHSYHEWKTDPCGDTGAVFESDFPYVASNVPCNCPYPHPYLIEDWSYIGGSGSIPPVDSIKQAIMTYGPVSVAVTADSSFHAYSGGIFNQHNGGVTNHAVVLVGWDDNQGSDGVWFLRNSWGTGWGENGGYMRIEYGCSSVGYAACYVDYPSSDLDEMICYGQDYTDIAGDVRHYGDHAIRMGLDYLGPDATAWYEFHLDDNEVEDGLRVGIEFCDWGWFGNGPNLYIFDFNSGTWDMLGQNMGSQDNIEWHWRVTADSNNYVDTDGLIWIKVYADALDDTILDEIGIKYKLIPKIPDLELDGELSWTWNNVEPGSTITKSFKVKNVGDSNSELGWEISNYPSWGTWTFDPSSGNNLKPEQGPVTVDVTIVAPNEQNQGFGGEIKIINKEDPTDFEIITVSLTTPCNNQKISGHSQVNLLSGNVLFNQLLSSRPGNSNI